MNGLLAKDPHNPRSDEPWKRSEVDKMLDQYLEGAHPDRIAFNLQRNPKGVERKLQKFTYNEKGKAEKYTPFRRVSRRGKRVTENDRVMLAAHQERNIPISVTARILQRSEDELEALVGGKAAAEQIAQNKQVAPTMDLVLAYRYVFHAYKKKLIPNTTYDDMKKEELEFGAHPKEIRAALTGDPKKCPRRIKTLALYLTEVAEDGRGLK